MERLVSIAGISVEVSADDDDRWLCVDALFGHCVDTACPPQVWIQHSDADVDPPDRPADLVEPDAEYWLDASGVAIRNSLGTVGRSDGNNVLVGGPLGPDSIKAFRVATQLPLIDVFGRHGRFVLHAATVAGPRGAVLVFGDSGSGKSTFAFGAHRRGWSLIADDLSVIFVAGNDIEVAGLPKPINIPGDVLDHQPPGARPIVGDERDRWVVPPTREAASRKSPIIAVVHVGHSGGQQIATHLAPGPDTMRDVLLAHPLAVIPSAMRRYFPVAARLSRVPTFQFLHSLDPADRLASVGRFLDDLNGLGDESSRQ